MKKTVVFICILICFTLFFSPFVEADEIVVTEIRVLSDGRQVMGESLVLNPEFRKIVGEDVKKWIFRLRQGFSDRELLNYLFFDLGDKLWGIFDELDDVSVEECITFFPNGQEKFSYNPNLSGRRVDRNKVLEKIVGGIGGRVEYEIEYIKTQNRYTLRELKECTKTVSRFSTDYHYSSKERGKNIALATSKINGVKILPGETFSFNGVVGERTEKNGYERAKIIQGGEYVDGVGGGVCQVASTLYNVALRADMEILECRQHSLSPSYVPLSFDAMVSEWSDLKFKNNSDTPIFIEGRAQDGVLEFVFYGTPIKYRLEFESKVVEVVRHKDWVEGSENYRNGYKSEGYLLRFRGDKLLKRSQIRKDFYKPYEIRLENKENDDNYAKNE